jgi:hypothetical protein
MKKYIDDRNLMPKELKGCWRGSKECEDQLLISKHYDRDVRAGKVDGLHWSTNFKTFFVSEMNMFLIYLFASIKVEKGHKTN